MIFPQYRMLSNGKSYYCVDDESRYTEVKVWGKYYEEFHFNARQYNDRLLVQDILKSDRFIILDKATFDHEINRIHNEYEKIEVNSGKEM